MQKPIIIAHKQISYQGPVFVIAEAGVNHNGKLPLAFKLVDVAKEAGADAVKFQTFHAEGVVTKYVSMVGYQKKNVGKSQSQFALLKQIELPFADFITIKKYCDKKGIIFLSTPHSPEAVDFLDPLVPAHKTGSSDLNNLPFLAEVAKKKKPIILSTAMGTITEIREAIKTIKKRGNNKIIILHCTNSYPCPPKDVNLRAMLTLKKEFNLPVGYSDHTLGITIPIMATTLGAQVIEKHFTLSRKMSGPDHAASLEPQELKQMVLAIREAETALGSEIKKPTKTEEGYKKEDRKSIIAEVNIKKGAKISRDTLSIKRPGTGIEPKFLDKIIGKKAKINLKMDHPIKWDDVV